MSTEVCAHINSERTSQRAQSLFIEISCAKYYVTHTNYMAMPGIIYQDARERGWA